MANYNLTGQKIKNTYDQLAQVSASLLVDGLGNATTITSSNIQNFSNEVSASAAAAGFGSTAGLVTDSVFVAYTASTDTKIDNLTAATSSYLTEVPDGTISSSAQVVSSLPDGTISSSAQVDLGSATGTAISASHAITASFALNAGSNPQWDSIQNKPAGLVSSSAQTISNLPSGTVSSSAQVSYDSISDVPVGIVSGAAQLPQIGTNQTDIATLTAATSSYLTSLPGGIVSSSAQVKPLLPAGTISSSAQVDYDSISNVPSGLVSGSSQVSFDGISDVPAGLISSSAQVDLGSATGTAANATSASFATNALSASYAPSSDVFPYVGDPQISGSLLLSGSLKFHAGGPIKISDYEGPLEYTSILLSNQEGGGASNINPIGSRNVQIGYYSQIVPSGDRSGVVVVGADAGAAQESIAIGKGALATNSAGGVALGYEAQVNQNYGISIGYQNTTSGYATNGINIGDQFQWGAAGTGSIQLQSAVRIPTTTLTIASNTASVDGTDTNYFYLNNAGGSNLVASPTNIQDGATYTFKIDDGRNLTWGPAYKWPNGVTPTLTSGSDVISFVSIGGTNLYGTAQYNFQ